MIKKASSSTLGAEALFASAFLYASTGILVRAVSPMWGDSAQVAARFVLALIFLLIYGLLRKEKVTIPKSKLPIVFGLGLVFYGMVLFFTFAIEKTTVANTLFIFYGMNMTASFILGTMLLKENITQSKLLALGFAFAGLALYAGDISASSLGIICSLLAGICGGAFNLFSKLLTGIDRGPVIIVQYAIGAILAVSLTLISGSEIIRTASLGISLLTVLFALVIVLGAYLSLYGFQHFDVNVGTVILSTELMFAAIMAYLFFEEVPKTHELIGGLLVFTGSIIGSVDPKKLYRPGRLD